MNDKNKNPDQKSNPVSTRKKILAASVGAATFAAAGIGIGIANKSGNNPSANNAKPAATATTEASTTSTLPETTTTAAPVKAEAPVIPASMTTEAIQDSTQSTQLNKPAVTVPATAAPETTTPVFTQIGDAISAVAPDHDPTTATTQPTESTSTTTAEPVPTTLPQPDQIPTPSTNPN